MKMDPDKEELDKFFPAFFSHLAVINFDKCREMLEKESQALKSRNAQNRQLFTLLLNFAETEKSYYNLGFMSTKKIFLRKDNSLKSMYETLRSDFNKLEEASSKEESFCSGTILQVSQYLLVRVQLIDFYERLYTAGIGTKHIIYDDLLSQLRSINSFSFTHPNITPIKESLLNEIEILEKLLSAQMELQKWSLIACVMHLQSASGRLTAWEKSLQNKESWKLGFLKTSQLPALLQWLLKLKAATINKFTLYFYQLLSQQTSPQEMKNYLSTRNNTDLYIKFQNLQKKSFASSVLLLFDPSGLTGWMGPGFQHPARTLEDEHSISQYLIMIAYPPLKYSGRMVGISKALSERSPEYTLPDKVVSVYHAEDKCSYFISSIDPRVTLVAIFDMKKDERDVNVVNHLTDFCSQARCTRVFQALKVPK